MEAPSAGVLAKFLDDVPGAGPDDKSLKTSKNQKI
jgi:hypothetical protein